MKLTREQNASNEQTREGVRHVASFILSDKDKKKLNKMVALLLDDDQNDLLCMGNDLEIDERGHFCTTIFIEGLWGEMNESIGEFKELYRAAKAKLKPKAFKGPKVPKGYRKHTGIGKMQDACPGCCVSKGGDDDSMPVGYVYGTAGFTADYNDYRQPIWGCNNCNTVLPRIYRRSKRRIAYDEVTAELNAKQVTLALRRMQGE